LHLTDIRQLGVEVEKLRKSESEKLLATVRKFHLVPSSRVSSSCPCVCVCVAKLFRSFFGSKLGIEEDGDNHSAAELSSSLNFPFDRCTVAHFPTQSAVRPLSGSFAARSFFKSNDVIAGLNSETHKKLTKNTQKNTVKDLR